MSEVCPQEQSVSKVIGGVVFQFHNGVYVAGFTEDAERVIYDGVIPGGQAGLELFKQWCGENNVYYYGRPHEQFQMTEAIEQAQNGGYSGIFLEDLS